MKYVIALQAALLSLVAAAPTTSSFSLPPTVVGREFFINGRLQRFAGTDSWWMGHLTSNDDVNTAMSQIAESGLQVTRVWGFGNANAPTNDSVYYQLLEASGASINYGTNGIARLDAAVQAAEKYGVKLVLAMLNNWDDLGGINTYTTAFGGNATSFYTDASSQEAYQGWIKFVVDRYRNSPAIFAWELCNECRCHGCSTSVITEWASKTSAYIKRLDPTHLVTLGDEGWFNGTVGDGSYAYGGAEGVDFIENLKIRTLDYGTLHLYPDQWGYNNTWGATWIAEHAEIGRQMNKAVVVEEYSTLVVPKTSVMVPWQETILSSGIAMDQIWQFGTTLPSGNSPFDDYTVYYNTTAGSDYEILVIQHNRAMEASSGKFF